MCWINFSIAYIDLSVRKFLQCAFFIFFICAVFIAIALIWNSLFEKDINTKHHFGINDVSCVGFVSTVESYPLIHKWVFCFCYVYKKNELDSRKVSFLEVPEYKLNVFRKCLSVSLLFMCLSVGDKKCVCALSQNLKHGIL